MVASRSRVSTPNRRLFRLIQQVNDDHTAVEVVSRHGEFEQHDLLDA